MFDNWKSFFTDDVRNYVAETGTQSDFLTTMSRDEGDVEVVRKCCVIIGNIVTSGMTKHQHIFYSEYHKSLQ